MAWLLSLLALGVEGGTALADAKTKLAQEAAEAVMARFGSKAVGRSLPTLAREIESFAARYGEEALVAVRRAGPEAFTLVEEAGVNGSRAVRVLAQYGEEGDACILRRPKAMQALLRYGDEAAAVLVRHPGIAEGLVEKGGSAAVRALGQVTPQGARRLAMVMEGELRSAAAKEGLLEVVGKYGPRACDFIWENKGALAVGATLTAFVANPEPFLDGTVKLAGTAADSMARPVFEGIGKNTDWTVILLVVLGIGGLILVVKAARSAPRPRPPRQEFVFLPRNP
jgi:hypothetical protein